MLRINHIFILIVLSSSSKQSEPFNTTVLSGSNSLGYDNETSGPWSSFLEDWTVGASDHRQERIMRLPITQGYYISNRIDNSSPIRNEDYTSRPPKITNSPPIYGYQKPNAPYVAESKPSATKEVTETDLYLLGAIEKLVYRVDFMEKRLKKAEEVIYYLMAGNKKNPEPCPQNFNRVGLNCYFFDITKEHNWKTANNACKEKGAMLAEMETIEENQDVVSFIQAHSNLRGKDFWTGGLNPGLLWIWSNSARPVSNGETNETALINNATNFQQNPMNIKGNGRCLKLAYNPTLRSYAYLGFDCAKKQNYVCEILDKSLSNEIQRISRQLNL